MVGDDEFLLALLDHPSLSKISISNTFDDPNIDHDYAVENRNGEYDWETVLDKKTQEQCRRFRKEHIKQAFNQKKVSEKCASSFPSYVYNIQFKYKGVWYRMFVKESGGKFALFYNIGVPYDGSNFLRLKTSTEYERIHIAEIPFSIETRNYPQVNYMSTLNFSAHRMVLFLWGGANNSGMDWNESLQGDHIKNDLLCLSILLLQWLTGLQNLAKDHDL